jgi:hypothetical protein
VSKPGRMITVGALVRAANVQRQSEVSWSVGRAAAAIWRDEHNGQAPPVALVPKTGGTGTHHMAVYPASWRPRLMRLVRLAASAQRAMAKPERRRKVRQPAQLPLFRGLR